VRVVWKSVAYLNAFVMVGLQDAESDAFHVSCPFRLG